MRKDLVVWVAASLLLAATAWAETGTITSVDSSGNTFTVRTDDGERITFRADPSTRILRDGNTIQLRELATGTRVVVPAPEAEGTAQRTASRVELVQNEGEAGTSGRVGASGEVGDTRVRGDAAVGAQANPPAVSARGDLDVDRDDDDRLARSDPRLPSTASPLPLIGLLGAGTLAAGVLIRRLRS
jgi:hypothetical protein